jgi:processive 1,2-diacylglycerol beta-glucosyltransferase
MPGSLPGEKRPRGPREGILSPVFSKSPRVLILSAAVGAGHVRAAEALEAAFAASSFPGEAHHVDVLRYTNRAFRTLYARGYIELVNKAPDLLGWLYDRFDVPWKSSRLQQGFEKLNLGPLVRLLTDLRPDWALCTHFLPAGIIAWLRRKARLVLPQAVAVTDFDAHAFWLVQEAEHYFVAREEAKAYLQQAGIPSDRISVPGIPIHPVFSLPRDKSAMRGLHGLDKDLPTILISVGGFGLDIASKILEHLLAVRLPIQVVAVAGKSADVQTRLERVADAAPRTHRVQVLGFTTAMDELMAAADLLVGKAGGLTSSEGLARGLPLLIINPIPGQEERNSDYLLEVGAALRCHTLSTLSWKIENLLTDPGRLSRLRAGAKAAARPFASFDIVNTMAAQLLTTPPEGLPTFSAPRPLLDERRPPRRSSP